MFIKVCGLKTIEQIDRAVELGYSAVGVVLHRPSPRYCPEKTARELARHARGRITTVAVGVRFDEVRAVHREFDYVQIYEYRKLDRLIYAGAELPPFPEYSYFLYDAGRGDGRLREFPEWLSGVADRLIISGGLVPGTVGPLIKKYRPFGVDVSSGVESVRGVKDFALMKQFIEEVCNAVA